MELIVQGDGSCVPSATTAPTRCAWRGWLLGCCAAGTMERALPHSSGAVSRKSKAPVPTAGAAIAWAAAAPQPAPSNASAAPELPVVLLAQATPGYAVATRAVRGLLRKRRLQRVQRATEWASTQRTCSRGRADGRALVTQGRATASQDSAAQQWRTLLHDAARTWIAALAAPVCGATGGRRGAAPAQPARRRSTTAAGSDVYDHATGFPPEGQPFHHPGWPCCHLCWLRGSSNLAFEADEPRSQPTGSITVI